MNMLGVTLDRLPELPIVKLPGPVPRANCTVPVPVSESTFETLPIIIVEPEATLTRAVKPSPAPDGLIKVPPPLTLIVGSFRLAPPTRVVLPPPANLIVLGPIPPSSKLPSIRLTGFCDPVATLNVTVLVPVVGSVTLPNCQAERVGNGIHRTERIDDV